jgi:hypothetical protein
MTVSNRKGALQPVRPTAWQWGALAALLLAGGAVVIFAPLERTLGGAVRLVYVHVALSRAGMFGFVAVGLVGLIVLAVADGRLAGWMAAAGWAALALYGAGFAVSIGAQIASWGGIAWREPRVLAAANVLAAAVIVQLVAVLLPWLRARGALRALFGLYQLWTSARAPNILHPGAAISGSESAAIRSVGVLLLVIALALGLWMTWLLAPRRAVRDPD